MPRPKKNAAKAEPITSAAPDTQIRESIKQMSGFTSEEQLANAIPESTATGSDETQKRKRRTKAEMALARGDANPELENDKRYKEATERMSAFGGSKTVRAAFAATGKPLDTEESTEVDDYFYVISKKFSLDATKSGLFLSIYAVLLMLRLVVTRMMGVTSVDLWSHFEGLFSNKEDEEVRAAEDEAEAIATKRTV